MSQTMIGFISDLLEGHHVIESVNVGCDLAVVIYADGIVVTCSENMISKHWSLPF